jgi:hypothetical protein
VRSLRIISAGATALALLLAGCATTPPSNTRDACRIFDEHREWFTAAKKSEDRWKIPMSVSLAFIGQESAFRQKAKPERTRILGIIPGPRPSDAYGYAQALKSTWKDYKRDTGNTISSRSSFADAVDFIGWYNARSVRENHIAPTDAYNLYLAYHEGLGGFRNRTFTKKGWLIEVARGVQSTATQYDAQLQRCENSLGRGWLRRLFS